MIWRVEIKEKEGLFDSLGAGIQRDILDFGIKSVKHLQVIQVYLIVGDIQKSDIQRICSNLLADPVTQEFFFTDKTVDQRSDGKTTIEIAYNTGVMDPIEASTIKGIADLGISSVEAIHTARKYVVFGRVTKKEIDLIVDKVLCNKLIQHVVKNPFGVANSAGVFKPAKNFSVKEVSLLGAKENELLKISEKGQLFLNLHEMKVIQKYFKGLKRNPTDCELETIAQTWSEHCHHKTFRGKIRYQEKLKGKKKEKIINNLLKSTIVKATTTINQPWCVSVFHDNAGVIEFNQDMNVCFKVETHNHPSALEPFGGANTGIGGVIRDILGTGLGAKPICNTDVFCFAPPDLPFSKLPSGTLHPKRIMKGVVSGVRDYGNKMGIPTVNGAILFDKSFVGNPLVYCGNVGLLPRGMEKKKVHKGDLIVTVGGRTGRDGIHGATFSSGELTSESETISSGAVQIGNPIQEKKVLDCLIQARDQELYTAITDCGAGGFSSAVGEMGVELGARVELDQVLLKYKGLTYYEIWISESQERMVMSVPPQSVKKLLKIFEAEDVEANVIGEFTGTKRLEIFYFNQKVCDLDMEFLHEGMQKLTKKAQWVEPKEKEPKINSPENLTGRLRKVLSHYNVCSKEWVIRQYDHEVQGGSVVKPLVGVNCDGPSDAAVVAPILDQNKGIAISNGINIRYGLIDPFWMAASCIDEAVRQVVAVGGNPQRIAILDNFCWGNPDKPDRLGSLVRAALGCYEAAVGFRTPFISGKDSLYNEYMAGKNSLAIPGTILISAIGIVDDIRNCITMDFKKHGNFVYVLGDTYDECGGSIYYDTHGQLGKNVPSVDPESAMKLYQAIYQAISARLIASAHDCSEGGLAVALAEMAFAGGLGVSVELSHLNFIGKKKTNDVLLFSESNSRLVVEVAQKDQAAFEKMFAKFSCRMVGRIEAGPDFTVFGLDGKKCIRSSIDELKKYWQQPLKW